MRSGAVILGISVSTVLLAVAGYLYVLADNDGGRHYRKSIDLVRQMQVLSSGWSVEITRVRSDPFSDFDSLVAFIPRMARNSPKEPSACPICPTGCPICPDRRRDQCISEPDRCEGRAYRTVQDEPCRAAQLQALPPAGGGQRVAAGQGIGERRFGGKRLKPDTGCESASGEADPERRDPAHVRDREAP